MTGPSKTRSRVGIDSVETREEHDTMIISIIGPSAGNRTK